MLKKLFGIIQTDQSAKDALAYRNVIRNAARMGGTLFGPTPTGVRREFFCLDEHTWVWHEEWTNSNGLRQVRTTRYDIRPHGIFKAQDGLPYQPVDVHEARNFYTAALQYQQNIHASLNAAVA